MSMSTGSGSMVKYAVLDKDRLDSDRPYIVFSDGPHPASREEGMMSAREAIHTFKRASNMFNWKRRGPRFVFVSERVADE